MTNPWFRFYSETLHDRKLERIARVTEEPKALLVGVWATLLALANDSPERGVLLLTDDLPLVFADLCLETGLTSETLGDIIEYFIAMRMLSLEEGIYYITNWDKRQFISDSSADRVRRYRERQAVTNQGSSNDDVTLQKQLSNLPDTDTDTDTEADTDKGAGAHPPDFLRLQFEMSVPVIQDMQLTRSQWEAVLQSEKDADGRKTLINWIDSKLNGGGHPAVAAYREEMEHNPRKNQYGAIIDAIGESGKVDVWRGVVRDWKLYGWNPYNIAGMIDAFKAGGVQAKPHGGNDPPQQATPLTNYQDPDEFFSGGK